MNTPENKTAYLLALVAALVASVLFIVMGYSYDPNATKWLGASWQVLPELIGGAVIYAVLYAVLFRNGIHIDGDNSESTLRNSEDLKQRLMSIETTLRSVQTQIDRPPGHQSDHGREAFSSRTLSGEWRGMFRVVSGGKPDVVTEYRLVIVEHPGRSPYGLLVYEGRRNTTSIAHAGSDELLPGEILPHKISQEAGLGHRTMIWKPTFRRCVHWQPKDDPRPDSVKSIDDEEGHLYEWDFEITFTETKAQMKGKITAVRTNNVFEGTLERR